MINVFPLAKAETNEEVHKLRERPGVRPGIVIVGFQENTSERTRHRPVRIILNADALE